MFRLLDSFACDLIIKLPSRYYIRIDLRNLGMLFFDYTW